MKKMMATMMTTVMLAAAVTPICAYADEIPAVEPVTPVAPADDVKYVDGQKVRDFTKTDLDASVDAKTQGVSDDTLIYSSPEAVEQEIVDIAETGSDPKIYVDVAWEELLFVYDFGTVLRYEWDTQECVYNPVYEYANEECEAWINPTRNIIFTNHSNRDVYIGVSFEMNGEETGKGGAYENVEVSFDKMEELIETAVCRTTDNLPQKIFQMTVSGTPLDRGTNQPELGKLKFYISEEARVLKDEPATETTDETPSGEHEHHYVYDQFGRLVCTGCNAIKHEYCIDEDEDGLCDECGLERDFCPDCHVGGTCRCI